MTVPLLAVGVAGLLGLAVGSFLNVVIDRVPLQQSIMSPGSTCPVCSVPIRGRHIVPVLGWVITAGRCHRCRMRISPRYPLVEAGSAVLFAAITVRFGLTIELPAYLYLAAVGVVLALIDLDVRRLPDAIVLPSYIVCVLLLMPAGAAESDWFGAERAVAGMVALLALFFALALAYPNGLGMGDVKLAGLLGMYLGWLSWNALFLTAVGSILIAAVTGSFAIVTKHGNRNMAVPIGPCLVSAAVLALFLAAPISTWYGSLMSA